MEIERCFPYWIWNEHFFFIDNNVNNIVIGSYTLVEFTHIATMRYMTNIGGFE